MMSKWKRLTIKTEELKINDELTATISGLSFKELGHLAGFQDKKDFEGAMNYILFVTLRKSISRDEASDDEVRGLAETLDGKTGTEIVRKVQELTGLSVEEKN